MKKIIKVFLSIIIIFIISNRNVYAYEHIENKYPHEEYVINDYDVDIKVNENNTYLITEKIVVYFNTPKHGILRTLPLRNNVVRNDGTSSRNKAKITNIYVDKEYTTSKENNNLVIKIGSPNYTTEGEVIYKISYLYDIGKDPNKDFDEFYYNIIGNNWDAYIGHVSFKIHMPKAFNSKGVGFTAGRYGSLNTEGIDYSIDENVITGEYDRQLEKYESLTTRITLDEGYYVGAGKIDIRDLITAIMSISFVIISFIIWFIFGRDYKEVETVEFYPPDEFNSLDMAYLYKGKVNERDVTSLLIYLANKGYIEIEELTEKSVLDDVSTFKIKRKKEYDGDNLNERIFLEGLFKNDKNEITSNDLYNKFYSTMRKIIDNVETVKNKNKIFYKTSSKTVLIISMIIATFILISIPVALESEMGLSALPFIVLFPGIGMAVMVSSIIGAGAFSNQTVYVNGVAKTGRFVTAIFGTFWGIFFGGVPWCILVFPTLIQDEILLFNYGIGIICIVVMLIIIKYMPKRTPYGAKILARIKGFKNFLELCEKDKIESLVEQNPKYFYDILPYTYVLGISDKWIKKFESISLKEPDWYKSTSTFEIVHFHNFMDETIDTAVTTMTSTPYSYSSSSSFSSSGGSSGGGSSGGGSGGGGGSSW